MQTITNGASTQPFPTREEPLFIDVKVATTTHRMRVDAIRTITSCENYTEIRLAQNQRMLVRRTMREWEQVLPPAVFYRVHRSLFLNIDRIGRFERLSKGTNKVHFSDDASLSVQIKRRHWPELRRQFEARRRRVADQRTSEKSVAVLPFINLTPGRGREKFADGISEELLNALANIPGLRVAARTSAFFFKGRNVPMADIASQLGVRFIVRGSVRKLGRKVRVTAQLIDPNDGFHLWSSHFEREVTEVFAVQEEIAELISATLQPKIRPESVPPPSISPKARWQVLEGRHFWNMRTDHGFIRAITAFKTAITIDPGCATAYSGLADLHVVRGMYRLADGESDASDDLTSAQIAAGRALELDPSLAEPHAAIGFAKFHEGKLAETEAYFLRAFSLNSNSATAFQFFAWTLAGRGYLDRGVQEYAKAIALDPLSFINIDRHAAMLALARRFDEALSASERAASLRPDTFVGNASQRAVILYALDRPEEAVEVARSVRTTSRETPFRRNSDSDAIFVLRQAGHSAEATDYAEEILSRLPPGNYLRGFVLSAVGQFSVAGQYLQRTPPIMLPQLYWSKLWDDVRETKEFKSLIHKLGRDAEYRQARDASFG